MTPQEAANAMTDRQYRDEEPHKGFFAELAKHHLVVVFGASDDLMEFEGAIRDEVGGPGTAHLTKGGMLTNDCENDDCPHFEKAKQAASKIHSKWDERGFSWVYETDIPHCKFIIKEDDENYCEGIVFDLHDVP